ncbi:MAG: DUF4238 domain-containing protein [Clostridiales bacterium]|nr:DUF4238 domain-containing protein [Clostridiales bacterium]
MGESQRSHVRQHYIPQFILKNFCYDQNKERVYFFEAGEEEYSTSYVSNVFMERYLYSNAENNLEIEESLAKFETDIAPIFKKLNNDAEISLTVAEDERLRIFLSLLAFRTVGTRDQFDNMSDNSKEMYGRNSDDTVMKNIWLKNVHLVSQSRSIKDVLSNPEVSNPLKVFFKHEFSSFYMCILERRGLVDFLISDCYPVVMNGEGVLPNGASFHLPIYYFYPISDSRVIVLVTNNIQEVPRSVSNLDFTKTLKGPKGSSDRTHLLFRPEKLYQQDVEWINEMIIKNAKIGVVVKDLERCSDYL